MSKKESVSTEWVKYQVNAKVGVQATFGIANTRINKITNERQNKILYFTLNLSIAANFTFFDIDWKNTIYIQ